LFFRIILSIGLVITIAALSFAFSFMIDIGFPGDMEGIQAQLIGGGGSVIANNANVVFDDIVTELGDNIGYNPVTGAFTINRPGDYFISWAVAPDGAGLAVNVTFAITVNGLPYAAMSSPIVSGVLSGEALVSVGNAPAVITLRNLTGDGVFVPMTPVQADIVIYRL
jgi:hypothetical protein